MTTTISFATADGVINSVNASYSTAQNGSGLAADSTSTTARWGQDFSLSAYRLWELFFSFAWTALANDLVVGAYFDLYQESTQNAGIARNLETRPYDWGATLDTADWRTVSQLFGLTPNGAAINAEDAALKHLFVTDFSLNTALESSGPIRIVAHSTRHILSNTPSGAEYSTVRMSEFSGTSTDPALVVTTVEIHSLLRVGGAAVQLSDGQHVYLEANNGGSTPTIDIKRRNLSGTVSTIALDVLADGFGSSNHGFQSACLIRDDLNDNLYLLTHTGGGNGNRLSAKAWERTGTDVWTARTRRFGDMPSYEGIINNVVATFHPWVGQGTIMALVAHEPAAIGSAASGAISYALINCDHLLDGVGSFFRASGDALTAGLVTSEQLTSFFNNNPNETGSCLDVTRLPVPEDGDRGVVISTSRKTELGDYAPVSIVRYQLNASGNGFNSIAGGAANTIDAWATKDASSKIRVLPISSSSWAVVTVDKDTGWGVTIKIIQNIRGSTTFTELGGTLLGAENLTSMPAPSTLAPTLLWDAVYQPSANRILVFYFDVADNRKLMRTSFDLNSFQAVRDEVVVNNAVGATGTVNHAIRAPRHFLTQSQALISIANKTGGGVESTIHVLDPLNIAPDAPTLTPHDNYDATQTSSFFWTFSDPNVGDTQSAYEFQIDNADTLASVVATGKVVSATSSRSVTGATLTNGVNYRWRVRTWDASDVVGPWSSYSFFSTSSGGTTNITNPASDNPAGVVTDTFTVTWTATGTTQASYRVRVVRTSDSVQLSDTGFVASVATSHEISGLLSDTEYRIEVTVRNAALVVTNTATRLITASYNSPETPLITATSLTEVGCIEIDIENPLPGSLTPSVLDDFEADAAGYTTESVTLTQDSAQAHQGTFSAKLVVTGTPTAASFFHDTSNDIPAVAGKRYKVRGWLYSPAGHTDASIWAQFRDGTHATVSGGDLGPGATSIAAATWTFREFSVVAPAGTQFLAARPRLGSNPPTGMVLHTDELEVLEDSDKPEVTVNQVQRRVSNDPSSAWTTIAEVGNDESYQDFHVTSGVTYEYRVVGVGGTGSSTSATVTAILTLQGVWMHVPADPANTARNYRFGREQRGAQHNSFSALTRFAGREFPVADFARYHDQVFSVTVDIPHGETWRTDLNALYTLEAGHTTLVYRDNRGRFAFGVLTGLAESDRNWGTQVSFDFTRVDYAEAVS